MSNKKPESLILKNLHGTITDRVPFWLMRQAGRYLPEYRAVREKAGGFLAMCYTPELAAEVTLQPLRRYNMDAAIIFSDILVIPHALGQSLRFAEGEGPRLPPLNSEDDLRALSLTRVEEHLSPVFTALRMVRKELSPDKALIGFIGAPWTVACYMIDGQGGSFSRTQKIAKENPDFLQKVIDLVVQASSLYLLRQIEAGADVVQIFDSWAGSAPEEDFKRWVVDPCQAIVKSVHARYPGFPVIGFPRGCSRRAALYAKETGVAAVGIDQSADMAAIVQSVPSTLCLQGNLDPDVLLRGGDVMRHKTHDILTACAGRPFIFNLGHGIIKETPPEHVAELADMIHGFSASRQG